MLFTASNRALEPTVCPFKVCPAPSFSHPRLPIAPIVPAARVDGGTVSPLALGHISDCMFTTYGVLFAGGRQSAPHVGVKGGLIGVNVEIVDAGF